MPIDIKKFEYELKMYSRQLWRHFIYLSLNLEDKAPSDP